MREHALNGEVGLSGIGRAQHRRDPRAAGSRRSGRLLRKTDSHYASGLAREPWSGALPRPPCITMRRQAWTWLSFRTSLERNAPESLTPELYDFVHGDIWRAVAAQPQDGVAGPRFKCALAPLKVNADLEVPGAEESRGTIESSCRWRRPGSGSKRTLWRQAPPGQWVSALERGLARGRGSPRRARARPPCRAAWRDI